MELKEGMYIRYIPTLGEYTQKISKITKTKNCLLDMAYTLDNEEETVFSSHFDEILKASFNIIDLIEEKDFCEIEFYSERYKERVKRIFEVGYVVRGEQSHISFENAHCQLDIINGEWSKHDKCLNPEIKIIVTKEQFESMSYKVGDDK